MFNYGTPSTNPASDSIHSIQFAKTPTPSSDQGASVGKQSGDQDTSGIFYGSSMDKATSWRVHRGAGSTPNAATVGRGNVFAADSAPSVMPRAFGSD